MSKKLYLMLNKHTKLLESFQFKKPKSLTSIVLKIKLSDWVKSQIMGEYPVYLKVKIADEKVISEEYLGEADLYDYDYGNNNFCESTSCKGNHLKSNRYPYKVLSSSSCKQLHKIKEESQEYILQLN